ncbi:unnamed protein product [Rotaria sp. Silwood2]|nr:unnamed protein product [Rotaria sp. Silwood2]CAF3935362.1 unnamed protein product [Rotaria sp. Silwood2]
MTIASHSTESCYLNEDDNENDQRRKSLLNDPNYGIVLCFLDKFRNILSLPDYPLQRFEDHLVNCQEPNSPRLIDFHFTLLKRLSLAKNAQHEKFDSIITKFASRFDVHDSEHLKTTGYLQADINLKIRTIKNLLESQFDVNQILKNSLINKLAREIKSSPLGRDRFGVSYWFFMDKNCFVRLFREDINIDRTWTNIANNCDELENFIKLLITDFVVRKKFPDWIIDYEQFSSLQPSNDFEQYYSPTPVNVSKEDEEEMKTISDNDNSNVSIKKKHGRSKASKKSSNNKINTEIKQEVKTSTRRGRKRSLSIEEHYNDDDDHQIPQAESSMDDVCLSTRRSSRLRKVSNSVVRSKTISQFPGAKKKRSMNSKTNVSNNRRTCRRRKTKSRRNIEDYLCSSTSSSDEHIDYLSEDEYNSDDYLPNQSQIDIDNNFFELEQEENTEPLHTTKTAQTSTTITSCCVCLQNDRPEILLLCNDCNDGYHLECLQPILLSIPNDDWFCPLCEHKKLSNCLIEKLKELLINMNENDMKQQKRLSKKSFQRKTKTKIYNSDESITASESEHEDLENCIRNEESILLTCQTIDNSNLSSSYFDDNKYTISQRGRHRRIRFDMKQLFDDDNNDEFNNDSDTNDDDDYNDNNVQITNFNLELPKKITRLLHRRDRSSIKNHQQTKSLTTRVRHNSFDLNDTTELNEKIGSPIVYVNSDENSHHIKSFITSSKQTSRILRRWNDVQRRSRFKAMNMKTTNEITLLDCTDENSLFCPDDISLSHSNDSCSNSAIKDENNLIIHSNTSLPQSTNSISIDKSSSKNIVKLAHVNFDHLTRDIQCAVNEAQLCPITTTAKATDQQHVKRVPKTSFSPYMTKIPFCPLPLLLSKSYNASNIFKTNDSSNSTSLSNITLAPSSPLSSHNTTHDQTPPITNI